MVSHNTSYENLSLQAESLDKGEGGMKVSVEDSAIPTSVKWGYINLTVVDIID
jgi:hypothetical protein